MFSPADRELERGWPGRIDGDRVIQLAAQTLQAFFTGGGDAREHAVYALDDVVLRAPVLHPPSVRIFAQDGDFVFANPTAIKGPDDVIKLPEGAEAIEPVLRVAAVIGASGSIAGFTLMNDWHAPELEGAKADDFATSIGPYVLTPDEFEPAGIDFAALADRAARNTRLLPGELLAAGAERREPARAGDVVEVALPPFEALRNSVA